MILGVVYKYKSNSTTENKMLAQTLEHNGKTINIKHDDCAESPRTWDNLGTMICFHRRYDLGDKHNIDHNDYNSFDEMEKAIEKKYDAVVLPLYLYDHSGITISTSPFSCNWDSGQVGFIAISKEKARNEYGWKAITKKRKELLTLYLEGEVETYDQYLRGDIFGYEILNSDGEIEDSCWGFYGEESAIEEAKAVA